MLAVTGTGTRGGISVSSYINATTSAIIDFNKSLNPPCVFSIFTTCPIPRKENKLSIKINAGEKNYNGVLFSSVYQ